MLNQFPRGRRLQVLSDEQKARLMGIELPQLNTANKYAVLKALNVVKRVRGTQAEFKFSDVLYLAAKEHALDICNNGAVGSIGSDGVTLPQHRLTKFGRAFGLEDYIVANASSGLDVVMQLILGGNAKNLLNGYLKDAAVASCEKNGANVFVVYLAENSLGNAFAAQTIRALKSQKQPLNAEAEAAIVVLKE